MRSTSRATGAKPSTRSRRSRCRSGWSPAQRCRCPMMRRTESMRVATVGGRTLVDLGYGGDAFSMTVILPREGETVEVGTEAAAVTTIGIEVTSLPQRTVVSVDRPFVFALRERLSGTILFVGKIMNPPAS
ncbi:MAG: hypothetical protein IPF87_01970 [Gemmatimonadetes bacterium]|nr:hypothetical protein [Gemmatimonadota bacterium]